MQSHYSSRKIRSVVSSSELIILGCSTLLPNPAGQVMVAEVPILVYRAAE